MDTVDRGRNVGEAVFLAVGSLRVVAIHPTENTFGMVLISCC